MNMASESLVVYVTFSDNLPQGEKWDDFKGGCLLEPINLLLSVSVCEHYSVLYILMTGPEVLNTAYVLYTSFIVLIGR